MSKDTFHTLVPINWLLRVTGLSNIYRKGNHLTESGSKIKSFLYIITLGVLNIFFGYHKVQYFQGNRLTGLVRFTDSLQMSYFIAYQAYIINIICVYRYNRVSLLNHLIAFDQIDSVLGAPLYDQIRNSIFSHITVSMIVFFFTSIYDYITWTLLESWHDSTLYSIDYLYFFLNMLTILDLVSHVIQVEYRLKMICDLLQNCNSYFFKPVKRMNTIVVSAEEDNTSQTLNSLNALSYTKHMEIAWFHNSYLALLDRVAYLNRAYGFRVLVYCINLLINTIYLLNLALRTLIGTMHATFGGKYTTYLPCGSASLRALNYGFMVTILMYRCEQNYNEANRILESIDALLASQTIHSEMKTSLLEFRNLIITRPIKFHAINFFTMDYTLLVSLASVVVTYTIIILQSYQ